MIISIFQIELSYETYDYLACDNSHTEVIKFYEMHAADTANPDKKSDAALDLIVQNADVVIAAQGD